MYVFMCTHWRVHVCTCVWKPEDNRYLLKGSPLPSFKDGVFHWIWNLPIGWTAWLASPSLEAYLSHTCPILVAQNHNLFDVSGHCWRGIHGRMDEVLHLLLSQLDDPLMWKLLTS